LPATHGLALGEPQWLGTVHGEDSDTVIRLSDDSSQPYVGKIRAGVAVVGRALRRTPSAAEQRSGKGHGEKLVEPRTWLPAHG
jgi:hypothetical protein